MHQREHRYQINDVVYVVGAEFEPPHEGRSLWAAFERLLSGRSAHLINLPPRDIIASEYVCSAAGEEDQ